MTPGSMTPIAAAAVFLVRHGETVFNRDGRHHGHLDSPLTDLGKEQARRAGRRLAHLIDGEEAVIWTSPLGRALQTAGIIAHTARVSHPIVVEPDLREIGMGSAEGLLDSELRAMWASRGHQGDRAATSMTMTAPDGETLSDVTVRMTRALSRIEACADRSRIVVTHGVAARLLVGNRLGLRTTAALGIAVPHDSMFYIRGDRVIRIDC